MVQTILKFNCLWLQTPTKGKKGNLFIYLFLTNLVLNWLIGKFLSPYYLKGEGQRIQDRTLSSQETWKNQKLQLVYFISNLNWYL